MATQIPEDSIQCRMDGASAFNTRIAWGRLLLDPTRGEEKLRESPGSTTTWWWSLRFFCTKLYAGGGGVGEEGAAPGEGVRQPSHLPSIYRGKGEGGRPPPDGSRGGRQPRGEACPPSQGGAPFRIFPNPRRMGPRGRRRPAHLGASSPPYSAHRALRGRWTPETLSVDSVQYQ